MKYTIFLILFVLASFIGHSQSVDDVKSDIAYYGDIVMNAASSEHRIRANDSLNQAVDRFLKLPASFDIAVVDAPWISVQQDEEKTFRVLTWQLNIGDSSYLSFGRIQLRSNDFIVLYDNKSLIEPKYRSLDANNWMGARYYGMKKFTYKGQAAFVLFGYDGHSQWNRQKIADILYFQNGQAKFGLPVFVDKGKDADRYGAYRIILRYSLDSRVSLDFDKKLNMIVHDHLATIQGQFPGQGETAIGDGSYEGYRLNNDGLWVYHEKLFEEVSDEPLDSGKDHSEEKKRDLFGKTRQ